jgi:hypothetical protein
MCAGFSAPPVTAGQSIAAAAAMGNHSLWKGNTFIGFSPDFRTSDCGRILRRLPGHFQQDV